MGLFLFIGSVTSFFEARNPIWPYDYLGNITDRIQEGITVPWPVPSTTKSTSTQTAPQPFVTPHCFETLAFDDVHTILGYLKRFPVLIGKSDDWEYVYATLQGYCYLVNNGVEPRPAIRKDPSIIAQVFENVETILQLDKRIVVLFDCQNHKGRSRVLYTPE